MRWATTSKDPIRARCAPMRSVADSAGATTTNVLATNAAASAKPIKSSSCLFLLEVNEDFHG